MCNAQVFEVNKSLYVQWKKSTALVNVTYTDDTVKCELQRENKEIVKK